MFLLPSLDFNFAFLFGFLALSLFALEKDYVVLVERAMLGFGLEEYLKVLRCPVSLLDKRFDETLFEKVGRDRLCHDFVSSRVFIDFCNFEQNVRIL